MRLTKPEADVQEEPKDRYAESSIKWSRRVEFTLSCIGFTVGLGNIWRFPYLCMRNGGGAYLIPYFTFLLVCGLPLLFLEFLLGQFTSLTPISVWNIAPLFKGLGWGTVIVTAIYTVEYNAIVAWILYYLGMSFGTDVPWRTCDNSWNTPSCVPLGVSNSTSSKVALSNGQPENVTSKLSGNLTAAEEFWTYNVLDMSDGITNLGGIRWQLLVCWLAAWIVVYICVCRGIKSSGKVVYVTVTMPYLFLTILLIRGVTLPGSLQGIRYYIYPDWSRLATFKVWAEACQGIFYSLGPAWGVLITFASHNKFDSNCLNDALVVCAMCSLTSFFGGFVIFSAVDYMAYEAGLPVDEVITQGPGLAFVAYPDALSRLPISPFWAVCFFLMLLTVGLDSQFGQLEAVCSSIIEEFPIFKRHRNKVFVGASVIGFIVGLPLVTRGGMYIFHLTDWYTAAFSITTIGLLECIVVGYVYGIGRFYEDISLMLNRKPSTLWAVCWCGISPMLLLVITVVSAISFAPPTYGDYVYPWWAHYIGWTMAMLPIIPIPAMALYTVCTSKGSLKERLAVLTRPTKNWGPRLNKSHEMWKGSSHPGFIERMRIKRTSNSSLPTDGALGASAPEKVALTSRDNEYA